MINALMADIQAPGSSAGSHPALDYRKTEFSPSSARSSFASYLEHISQRSSFSTTASIGSTNLSRQDEFAMDVAHQQRDATLRRYAEQSAAEEHSKLQADAQAASERRRASSAEKDDPRAEPPSWSETNVNSETAGSSAEQKSRSVKDSSQTDTRNENTPHEKAAVNTEKIEDGRTNRKNSGPNSGEKGNGNSEVQEEQSEDAAQVAKKKIDTDPEELLLQDGANKRIKAEDAREDALKKIGEEGPAERLVRSEESRGEADQKKAEREVELKEAQLSAESAVRAAKGKNASGENELQSAAAVAEGRQGGDAGEKRAIAPESEGTAHKLSLQSRGDEKREGRGMKDSNSRRSAESEAGAKLTVIDKRGAASRHSSGNPGSNSGGSDSRQQNFEFKLFSSGKESGSSTGKGMNNESGDSLQVLQVNLRGEAAQSFSGAAAKGSGAGIRNELMQQLQEHLNKDIVKRSSILIRENGSGEIKLDLKPDNLGQVRIRITMENNNIAGKIFVENSNVKEAFDQNMQQLYRAFKEHGFENAALNVSVGDQGSEQRERGRSHGPQASLASQVRALDEQGSPAHDSSGELRLIDVMA